MKTMLNKTGLCILICLLPLSNVLAQAEEQVTNIVNKAVSYGGGTNTWNNNGTLIVHEFQKRYEEKGVVIVDLTHTMKTDGSGYRIELSRQGKKSIYGWDGSEFWAQVDGKPGSEEDVSEARRVISDSYFRFTLPFVLENEIDKLAYEGEDTLNGNKTEVLKITYDKGPADRYFSSHDEHSSGSEHKAEAGGSEGHHHGGEVYFYHFSESGQLKKVYFSHHGDGTYETLLYKNIKPVNGISRDHKRTLLKPDGNIHYESFFSKVGFSRSVDAGTFNRP
jgi:hypothetical protein